jgi:endonuclease YncB( thermonuclease family)
LVKNGIAKVDVSCECSDEIKQRFLKAESIAKYNKKIIWSGDAQIEDKIPDGKYEVEKWISNNTLVLKNGIQVQLHGVGKPKSNTLLDKTSEYYQAEAMKYLKKLMADNKNQIRISTDPGGYSKDPLTHVLVWIGDLLLNEELVRRGYGEYNYFSNCSDTLKSRLQSAADDWESKYNAEWERKSRRYY